MLIIKYSLIGILFYFCEHLLISHQKIICYKYIKYYKLLHYDFSETSFITAFAFSIECYDECMHFIQYTSNRIFISSTYGAYRKSRVFHGRALKIPMHQLPRTNALYNAITRNTSSFNLHRNPRFLRSQRKIRANVHIEVDISLRVNIGGLNINGKYHFHI